MSCIGCDTSASVRSSSFRPSRDYYEPPLLGCLVDPVLSSIDTAMNAEHRETLPPFVGC